MKNLLLVLFLFMISYLSKGQVLINESFDSTAFPPAGWSTRQVSGEGSKSIWERVITGTDAVCGAHSGEGFTRFFGYNLKTGKSAILVSPPIDLSGTGSNSGTISLWMFRDNSYPNTYDSLDVYINDTSILSGAVHLGKIIRHKGQPPVEAITGWYRYSFMIPASFNGTKNHIILKATSLFGYDIMIDDIMVKVSGPNDAGIFAITLPDSSAGTGNNPVRVSIKNFGNASLNSTAVGWSVNGVACTPYVYLNSSGLATNAIDSSVIIGNYDFTTGGPFIIKAWTQYPNSLNDIDYSNDTATKTVWINAYATLPFEENFDGVWINKKDSNDVPSIFWNNTPVRGNNSWRRDDEGFTAGWISLTSGNFPPAGNDSNSHSARFHTFDAGPGTSGNLDLCLDFTLQGYKALDFWHYNENGQDSLSVLLSENGGISYSPVVSLSSSTGWTHHYLSLGSSTTPHAVVRFRATSDFGNTDIGVDSVRVLIDNTINTEIIENNSFVTVYPNPSNGLINIDIRNISDAELSIFSLSGQQVYSNSSSTANTVQQLDLTWLPRGAYVLQIKNDKNNIIRKLVIQ
ncbi:MAG TPA: T9SS type A sorting domain-containing protein [Bacteroidales bacterium]|nr:T9SS type A sorting domain-containing protein [Bacteroidales bacterium]HOH84327.1 T9SS type A sorting domain-containing protein [Bacteroidales bacterium]